MRSIPEGAVRVERDKLAPFNSYGEPEFLQRGFYADVKYTCARCGEKKVWTAAQQKLWYERQKGQVYSTARYCTACRRARKGGPQKRESTPAKRARDPRPACARVRALGNRGATAESRAEVEAYLENGPEQVQSVAAQVLAGWGGRESVEALRRWLPRIVKHPSGSKYQIMAARLLAGRVERKDAGWVLHLFDSLRGEPAIRYWLGALFRQFSWSGELRRILTRESEDEAAPERIRALFFLNMLAVDGRERVFERLSRDKNEAVREYASALATGPASAVPTYRITDTWVLGPR